MDSLFCQECKSTIAADSTFCGRCHAPIVRRYCPGCSRLVPETSQLCPYCGESAKAPMKKNTLQYSLFVAVGGGLALSIFLLGGRSDSSLNQEKRTVETSSPVVIAAAASARSASATEVKPAGGSLDATENDPVAAGTKLNMEAHDLMLQGRFGEAIPVLKEAIKKFGNQTQAPAYKFALYNLAHSLRRTGHPGEAVNLLEQCLKLDPTWDKAVEELQAAKAAAGMTPRLTAQMQGQ